jgi:hypothetical protein
MGKLPKSEAWKQSDPHRLGLLPHPKYLSRDSLSESVGFRQSFTLEQTRAENPCRTPKDSGRASALELCGGLLTGQENIWPLEPHHSLEKATASYYTKNGSSASGISKMWCVF